MDVSALTSIKTILSEPALKDYLSNNLGNIRYLELIMEEIIKIETFMKRRSNPRLEEQVLVEDLQVTFLLLKIVMENVDDIFVSRNFWLLFIDFFSGIVVSCNYWKQKEEEQWLLHKELVAVINSLNEKDITENLLLDTADCNSNFSLTSPNYNEGEEDKGEEGEEEEEDNEEGGEGEEEGEERKGEEGEGEERTLALLLVKTFPALLELKDHKEIFYFLLDLTKEIDNLPQLICKACEGQPLVLLLIGGLLSLKQCNYDTWNKVKDDLVKIKESATTNKYMQRIIAYCYNDLPHFLKKCFLYLACYPIGYEIPATSLTQLWIAEEFVTPQQGETIEETTHKYLEQLVQRSLVCVSKISFLGTIKYCQVPHSIHEFAIQRSNFIKFLVTNPTEWSTSGSRLAVHNDYEEAEGFFKSCDGLHSVLAFDFGSNFSGINARSLKVLELRNCAYVDSNMVDSSYGLRYIGLRGSNISELPEDLTMLYNLQTLDVRDTIIEIIHESLWNISTLRHVYVNPSLQLKGPPSTTNMSNLQIMKTVTAHESWLDNIPLCLINLRKLALSNRDNQYWKPVSNLLSRMVNLLSMTIIGDLVPSEFIDLRAFPNLETVKSIKFEGEWKYCKKLIIDNIRFPTNLTKLTLTKSGLKEDPMPRFERLEGLKFLSLQDGAYSGNKMVCSENGFLQLQILELKQLEKLENWEVNPGAMPQLTKLRVFQCLALKKLPVLEHVPYIVTDIM